MYMWIYISVLFCVGGVLCCRDGVRIELKSHSCSSAICIRGHWHREGCLVTIAKNTKNDLNKDLSCADGETYGDFVEPDAYYYCDHGTLTFRRCPTREIYDKYTAKCVKTSTKQQSKFNIRIGLRKTLSDRSLEPSKFDSHSEPGSSNVDKNFISMCNENTLYVNVNNASAYYKCENGKLIPQLCPGNEVFQADTEKCVALPSLAGVEHGLISNKRQCEHGETRAKQGSCKLYYECRHGTEFIARCKDCQNYDQNDKKCRYVFDSPCHSQFPEILSTTSAIDDLTTKIPGKRISDATETTSFTTEIIDTSTKIKKDEGPSPSPIKADNEFLTTEIVPLREPWNSSEPGSTALPFGECKNRRGLPDCKYYLECHEGELVTRRCGWLQYFDSLTSTCSYMGYKCFKTE